MVVFLLAGSALAAETVNVSQPAGPNPPSGNFTRFSVSGQVVTGDGTPIPGAVQRADQQAPPPTSKEIFAYRFRTETPAPRRAC